ncbi:MAG: hypothetical protein GXN97_00885 [Aquificae bacterium]|nr:hypothetical protein [Aquificota bacterium]
MQARKKFLAVGLFTCLTLTGFSSEEVFLDTSFEEFPVGSLPSGFEIIYNGKGDNYQVVTDKKAATGSKSFQVWGVPNWCANVHYNFDVFKHRYVVVDYKMYATDQGNNGWISLINQSGATWGWGYCWLGFTAKDNLFRICYTDENGNNQCTYYGPDKVPMKLNAWNDIRLILDTKTTHCTVYLNGYKFYTSDLDIEKGIVTTTYYFKDGSVETFSRKKDNPSAYYGLHGIRIGDCPSTDNIDTGPTYFDDVRVVGTDEAPVEISANTTQCLTSQDIGNLPSGWDNIGILCSLENSQIAELFKGVTAVWHWNNQAKKWEFWSPDVTLQEKAKMYGIEAIDELPAGDAVWILK